MLACRTLIRGGEASFQLDRLAASGEEYRGFPMFIADLRDNNGGSNTYGGDMFGNVCSFYLPYSGLKITCGITIGFMETTQNTEGIGILPDLWVNPADAMDAVLRLIDHYGLKNAQTAAPSAS